MEKIKVIVVGGGFAGLEIIKRLRNNDKFSIILVDINNYNFFPPLLYQVATGFMEPSAISYPFRRILRGARNVQFRMGTLKSIDHNARQITLDNGELSYDRLILSTGAITNFFGNQKIAERSIPMKTIADSLAMRNYLLKGMEKATRITDTEERKKLLNIVIAGAGPTGVELAGMFAEMRKTVIRKDYPDLVGKGLGSVVLIDGANTVLAPMSKESQVYTYDKLTELGVQIILNVFVKDYDGDVVVLSDGNTLHTKNLIWSAGVVSRKFEGIPDSSYGRGSRLIVDGYNEVVGMPGVYALGDTCLMTADPAFPEGHPQLAQVAIQQADRLATNLNAPLNEKKHFIYNDKGSMAIIGRNKAVADIPKPALHLKGFIAWFVWVFIHIMSLVNFRNKIRALYNWVGSYFTMDQTFRMIIESKTRER